MIFLLKIFFLKKKEENEKERKKEKDSTTHDLWHNFVKLYATLGLWILNSFVQKVVENNMGCDWRFE